MPHTRDIFPVTALALTEAGTYDMYERGVLAIGLLAAVGFLFFGVMQERRSFVTWFGVYLVG